jgi:CHRD domain
MKIKASMLVRSLAVAAIFSAISTGAAIADDIAVKLTGAQEVPAVATSASGAGTLSISKDGAVSGSVQTSGIAGTMAHIHLASTGVNGPPIIVLVKSGDNVWAVPSGAKLTDDQYKSFKNGDLYVNVHSDAHKGGEIRAQLKP